MPNPAAHLPILIAEDDPDDRLLVEEAIVASNLKNPVHFVTDGAELLDFLHQRGNFASDTPAEMPGIILLDLNMPRKSGLEALSEIKAHQVFREIPVVILSTTGAVEQVMASYRLGANSFITKPSSFNQLVTIIKAMGKYWFEVNTLPFR